MSLQLTENYKGIEANYWKILSTQQNFVQENTRIVIGLYKDHASRQADKTNVLKNESYVIDSVDLNRAGQYTALKNLVTGKDENGNDVKKFETALDV